MPDVKKGSSGAGQDQPQQGSRPFVNKVKKQYWLTKTGLLQQLNKLEDNEFTLRSAEVEAKLSVLDMIRDTSDEFRDLLAKQQKNLQRLWDSELELCSVLEREDVDRSTHSGLLMEHLAKSVKYCGWSRMFLSPVVERMQEEFAMFIAKGIRDTNVTVKELHKASKNLHAGLLWVKDVSKGIDPESPQQLATLKQVQTYVKESRAQIEQLNQSVTEKISILSTSRNSIFQKNMGNYCRNLRTHYDNCRKKLRDMADQFKGLPAYKFKVLAPILGPDNGGDVDLLDKLLLTKPNDPTSDREVKKEEKDEELLNLGAGVDSIVKTCDHPEEEEGECVTCVTEKRQPSASNNDDLLDLWSNTTKQDGEAKDCFLRWEEEEGGTFSTPLGEGGADAIPSQWQKEPESGIRSRLEQPLRDSPVGDVTQSKSHNIFDLGIDELLQLAFETNGKVSGNIATDVDVNNRRAISLRDIASELDVTAYGQQQHDSRIRGSSDADNC